MGAKSRPGLLQDCIGYLVLPRCAALGLEDSLVCFSRCDGWKGEGCLRIVTIVKGDVICAGSLLEEGFYQELCFGIRSGVDCFSILERWDWEGSHCPIPLDCSENILAVSEVIQLCSPVLPFCLAYCAAQGSLCHF
ncbi:uncharacterized protein ACHE_60154A [Aspergillus chevalieri]|uniref:Uncharacterized protein n=1 Tax=Aspergillus chevalieri TaxID=182096 RepID=A0A7R7VT10_ASPCH|nr:uncharacterized protein ACHE_60154A [Aspergillus chevalieri]BCR90268.1 hypothetical protein ACHE_60154A [Aspergillus chevalieri]